MVRKKELSNDIIFLIVKLLKSGISQRKVARTFGCAQSTVCEIWKKYRSRNNARNLPQNGRPRITSSRQVRKLIDLVKSLRRCTSKQLNAKWLKYEAKVCARIVQNRLNGKGFNYCKVKTKSYMTQQHKKKVIFNGARNINAGLLMIGKKVIFSD